MSREAMSEEERRQRRNEASRRCYLKRKAVKDTSLYGKIKGAVDKAIEKAASEGAAGIALLEVKIPGELGSVKAALQFIKEQI